jgi:hypothetical protein
VNSNTVNPSHQKQVSKSESILSLELMPRPMVEQRQGQSRKTFAANSVVALDVHTPPLMPMRERDLTAMAALFETEDAEDIEEEINSKLPWLGIAPCWEDNPL